MKLVTFAVAQAPHGVGDTRLVPDALADELEAKGVISASETWPPATTVADAVAARKPKRPILSVGRPAGVADQRIAR